MKIQLSTESLTSVAVDVLAVGVHGKKITEDANVRALDRAMGGVLLPQIYPDIQTEGTLYYIGVAPERRGEGWGKRLHAHGLALLASRGATRYVGSTDLRNEPMVRVFRHNRCNDRGVQVMYRNEE